MPPICDYCSKRISIGGRAVPVIDDHGNSRLNICERCAKATGRIEERRDTQNEIRNDMERGIEILRTAAWTTASGSADGHAEVLPIRECPNCGYAISASAIRCRHCGYRFTAEPPPPTDEDDDLNADEYEDEEEIVIE